MRKVRRKSRKLAKPIRLKWLGRVGSVYIPVAASNFIPILGGARHLGFDVSRCLTSRSIWTAQTHTVQASGNSPGVANLDKRKCAAEIAIWEGCRCCTWPYPSHTGWDSAMHCWLSQVAGFISSQGHLIWLPIFMQLTQGARCSRSSAVHPTPGPALTSSYQQVCREFTTPPKIMKAATADRT